MTPTRWVHTFSTLVFSWTVAACGGATTTTPDGSEAARGGESQGNSSKASEGAAQADAPGTNDSSTFINAVPEHQRPERVSCPKGDAKTECLSDDGCADGAVCGCELRKDISSGTTSNVCLTQSECTTNADCGNGHYCALSRVLGAPLGPNGEGGFYAQKWGYFCTTDHDTCRNDSDCATQPHDRTCVFYKDPPGGKSGWRCGGGP